MVKDIQVSSSKEFKTYFAIVITPYERFGLEMLLHHILNLTNKSIVASWQNNQQQGNSRKGFGRCRLSFLCAEGWIDSVYSTTNSWDDISQALFVNSPVYDPCLQVLTFWLMLDKPYQPCSLERIISPAYPMIFSGKTSRLSIISTHCKVLKGKNNYHIL